ncbi:thylakoid lumenal 16.5 kDa protein, chloroplastic-like [Juglans microcarpa x Juglans regia]|uniref:thylakoid lumenal 16.5 kDa protein, chloroplastic-like n=1 Tax=Juglans microcarpa x Juglans regia TaxID=2249226 RepID=UPI001B7E27AE|nr:thylakoid lumenal 16.5 kDa protein, chloroplastic-like [Juglans microcarpa x Juglans regia]
MATAFLSTANTFIYSSLSSSASPSSSLLTSPSLFFPHKHNANRQLAICKAFAESSPNLTKRSLSISFITSFGFLFSAKDWSAANAAILEADDDVELLEKVKKDRKKRIERQGVISSSNKETGYLQELVYKLSKVAQAIDNNDLSTASSVLGGSSNTEWVKNANKAFTKLSSSPEEKTQVDTFNSSLVSLISSVTRNDVESSKLAFVSSASAFQKWSALTGLVGQLKGL